MKDNTGEWIAAHWVERCQWWEVPGKETTVDTPTDAEFHFQEINETRIPSPPESEYEHRLYGEHMALKKSYDKLADPEYLEFLEWRKTKNV